MIYNYKQYESIFFKSFDEKLSSIEDLIVKLKKCREDIVLAWNKHRDRRIHQDFLIDFSWRYPGFHRLNATYKYFFKTRDKVLDIFNSLLEEELNQQKIDDIVNVWKDFENTTKYGSYNMTMELAIKCANNFITKANDFLEVLSELKNEYDIDLNTEDPFVLTKRNGDFVTPSRKSFDEERTLNLKNKYWNIDPLGEEDWEDEPTHNINSPLS